MYTTVEPDLMFHCQREGIQYMASSPEPPLFRCASANRLIMESHDNARDHQSLLNDLLEICVRRDYDPYSELPVFEVQQAQDEHPWLGYAFHQCRQAARMAAEKSPARAHLSRLVNTSIDRWMAEDLAARRARSHATGALAASATASRPPARVPPVPPPVVGLAESPPEPAAPSSPHGVPMTDATVDLPPPSPSRPAPLMPLAAPVGPRADCPATPVARPAPHDEASAAPAQDALAHLAAADPVSPPSMIVPCIQHADDDSSS